MVLLFITVVINYLDRSNLSIAAPALTSELGIDPIHVGLIFSAFGWTYAAMQIPGGWLVDRVPPRILYSVALLLWSIATVMLGFAGQLHRAVRAAHGGRCAGSAGVSDQQPRGHHLVSRARARHGHRFLHLRAVRRAGVPDPGAGLAAARTSAGTWCSSPPARSAFSGRLIWYAVYREPTGFQRRQRRRNRPDPRGRRPGGYPGRDRQGQGQIQLDRPRHRADQAQVVGHLPRPVLPELDAVVFPDVVPDLPGEISRHGLHQVRPAGVAAVSRGVCRRAVFGVLFRLR